MKKSIGLLLVGLALLCGCKNTATGIGKDMEKAGQDIQEEVR